MSKEKRTEMEKAVNVLRTLFDSLTEHSGTVMVGTLSNKEVITVVIRGACYDIDVECENVNGMVKSVVEQIILKL